MYKLFPALLLFLVMLTGCHEPVAADTLELHMLDVGNADCFLLKQGEAAMLIDGGEPDDADYIVSYLHTHGIEKLDAIILSHPHADHIGSAERVIKAYDTGTVYYGVIPDGIEAVTPLHTRLADAIAGSDAQLSEASDGTEFMLGGAKVEIYPLLTEADDANEYSLITRVSFGEEAILFTGDAKEQEQRALMNSGRDLSATILKMSHHGGKVDTTRAFLMAVAPKAALITCGEDNPYGHPHNDTVIALEERNIPYYRTDLHGTCVITIDEQGGCYIETTKSVVLPQGNPSLLCFLLNVFIENDIFYSL